MKKLLLLLVFLSLNCFSQEEKKEIFTHEGVKYSIQIENVSIANYDFWLQTDYPDNKSVVARMKMNCARKEYSVTDYAVFKDGNKIEEGNKQIYNRKIPDNSILSMILKYICENE